MTQKIVVLTSLCLSLTAFGSLAHAQSPDQPDEIRAIFECKLKASPTERLACYDMAVGRFEVAQNTGEVITVSKTQVENVEREAFGFNLPSLPSLGGIFGGGSKKVKTPKENPLTAPAISPSASQSVKTAERTAIKAQPKIKRDTRKSNDIKSVNLEIRKTTEFGYKKTRFFFTNGQVWEQIDGSRARIPKVRDGKPNTAQISKATLKSFFLKVNGSGSAIRVRRVR